MTIITYTPPRVKFFSQENKQERKGCGCGCGCGGARGMKKRTPARPFLFCMIYVAKNATAIAPGPTCVPMVLPMR